MFFELNPHTVWRRPLLVVLIAWVGTHLWACSNSDIDRYAYHVERSVGTFGDDRRLTLRIAPGTVARCNSNDAPDLICARASGPLPALRVANGAISSRSAAIEVTNVGESPEFAVWLEGLRADDEQDQRCEREELGPEPGVRVRLASVQGGRQSLQVPACTALVLRQTFDPARELYRVALLGKMDLRASELAVFVERLAGASFPPDYVQLLGKLDLDGTSNDLQEIDNLFSEVGLPWGAVIDPADVTRSAEAFLNRVGQVDYVSSIGPVPWLVADTASATVNESQLNFFRGLRTCEDIGCAEGVALMSIAPVSASRLDPGQFRSGVVGQRLLTTMSERGIETLISTSDGFFDASSFGSLEVVNIQNLDDDFAYAELLVLRPRAAGRDRCYNEITLRESSRLLSGPAVATCEADATCLAGSCYQRCDQGESCPDSQGCDEASGLCRRTCESARDCGAVAGRCESGGFCDETPSVVVRQAEEL